MATKAEAVEYAFVDELLRQLRADKPGDRSEQDRYIAITITEVEKAQALYLTFGRMPQGTSDERPPVPASMKAPKERDKAIMPTDPVHTQFEELLAVLRKNKPEDRSEQDRYMAITITEVEKAQALYLTFGRMPQGTSDGGNVGQ